MAEAHNNAAVALALSGNQEESRSELDNAIKSNPALTVVHENLVKFTINEAKERQDFWQYWNSSTRKRFFSIGLSLLAASVVIFGIILPFIYHAPEPSNETNTNTLTKKTTNASGSKITETSEVQTSLSNRSSEMKPDEVKIPDSYLVIVGFIILVILSPQLKTLKAGPVKVELVTREAKDIATYRKCPSISLD